MKQSANLIVMGFLVIGIWYSVGFIQGYSMAESLCDREKAEDAISKSDED